LREETIEAAYLLSYRRGITATAGEGKLDIQAIVLKMYPPIAYLYNRSKKIDC